MYYSILISIALLLSSCGSKSSQENPEVIPKPPKFNLLQAGDYTLSEVKIFTPVTGEMTYTASGSHKIEYLTSGTYINITSGDATLTNSTSGDTINITCGDYSIIERFLLNTRSSLSGTKTEMQYTAVTEPLVCSRKTDEASCTAVTSCSWASNACGIKDGVTVKDSTVAACNFVKGSDTWAFYPPDEFSLVDGTLTRFGTRSILNTTGFSYTMTYKK